MWTDSLLNLGCWAIVGALLGWAVSQLTQVDTWHRVIKNTAIGVFGAIAGGGSAVLLGVTFVPGEVAIAGLLMAVFGALVFLAIPRAIHDQ